MKKILTLILALAFCANLSFAQNSLNAVDSNETFTNNTVSDIEENSNVILDKVAELKTKIAEINSINQNNIWLTRYDNSINYEKLVEELNAIEDEIKWVRFNTKDKSLAERTSELLKQKNTISKKLESLSEYKDTPYFGLLKTPEAPDVPKLTNPIAIINGFSYIKQVRQSSENFQRSINELKELIDRLKIKDNLLQEMLSLTHDERVYKEHILVKNAITEFSSVYDISLTSSLIYEKRVKELVDKAKIEIKEQFKNTIIIALIIIFIILIAFLLKITLKKYMANNDNAYIINKVINIISISLIVLVLLFSYIDNMTYMVAILGVASAGIAIAMKDMFMNVLGWMMIVFGGSFSVGDRIKVRKDGLSYVGDIIDISLMRITMLEDVTLTSYLENKRSGRVVFVPNNYVFTTLIANYTHSSLKSLWDGIYLSITFESNHKKAMEIMKAIAIKHSKSHTEGAKKQLAQLRRQYNLKHTNVEPRIFSFIEPHGLTISVWYMTNAYAALVQKSIISGEIIDAINKESDIAIAYPTQIMKLGRAPTVQPSVENEIL